jgi:hypothetical protein
MKMISALVSALLLASAALAQAPAKPAEKPNTGGGSGSAPKTAASDPNSLEAQMAAALKSNADIQVAEAKLREAEAGLNKARITVMQQVAAAHAALHAAKSDAAVAEAELTRLRAMRNAVSVADIQKVENDFERAKAAVARAEADLALVLGKPPATTWKLAELGSAAFAPDGAKLWVAQADGSVRVWDTVSGRALSPLSHGWIEAEPKPGSVTERIRAALDKPIKIDAVKNVPLREVVELLQQKSGVDFPIRFAPGQRAAEAPVELMKAELPLSAWLLVVEDSVPQLRFAVREYGLLITSVDRMPEDAIRIRDFLRSTANKSKEAK